MHNTLYPTVIPPWYYSNLSMPMPSRAATLSSLSTMAADAPIEAFVLGLPPLLGTCCDVDLAVRLDFCFGLRRCLGLALACAYSCRLHLGGAPGFCARRSWSGCF